MRCPKCRHEFDYREAEVEEEWRKIIQLLPAFDGQGRLVMEYVEKFGVTPLAIKTKKMLRLLEEVGALFDKKCFTWKKAVYEISEKGIVDGLKVTCNAGLTTPLKDHNYLRAVLASIAMEEKKTLRCSAEADLRKREADRTKDKGQRIKEVEQGVEIPQCRKGQNTEYRIRRPQSGRTESGEEGTILSAEENARRAGELASRIGKKMQ